MPGVSAVLTAGDLEAGGIKPMQAAANKNRDGTPTPRPRQMALAQSKVRYVGDPVVCIVAETAKQARDAAETVMLDIDPLPAVTTGREAAAPARRSSTTRRPATWRWNTCTAIRRRSPPPSPRPPTSPSSAIRNSRVVVAQMEPRSAIGAYDPASGRYTLRVGCQGVWGMKNGAQGRARRAADKVHVLTGNVGGSFGMKASVYPEYPCLLLAAKQLGRPVKWTDERSESFLSDSHGRDHEARRRAGAGRGRASSWPSGSTCYGNLGAYLSNATTIPPTTQHGQEHGRRLCDAADRGLVHLRLHQHDPGRRPIAAPGGRRATTTWSGWSTRPPPRWASTAIELRRRNHIQPEQMPFKTAAGTEYDSGDFPTLLDKALALADWDGFAARRAESRARGKLRGRGIGQYLEVTAPPAAEDGRHPLRGGRHRHHHHRHARLRPGPRLARSRRCCATGSASRSRRSACCRATATS